MAHLGAYELHRDAGIIADLLHCAGKPVIYAGLARVRIARYDDFTGVHLRNTISHPPKKCGHRGLRLSLRRVQDSAPAVSAVPIGSTSIVRASLSRTARRYPFTNICTGSPRGAWRSTRNTAPFVMPMSRRRRRRLKEVLSCMRTIRATSPISRSYSVVGTLYLLLPHIFQGMRSWVPALFLSAVCSAAHWPRSDSGRRQVSQVQQGGFRPRSVLTRCTVNATAATATMPQISNNSMNTPL